MAWVEVHISNELQALWSAAANRKTAVSARALERFLKTADQVEKGNGMDKGRDKSQALEVIDGVG